MPDSEPEPWPSGAAGPFLQVRQRTRRQKDRGQVIGSLTSRLADSDKWRIYCLPTWMTPTGRAQG